MTAAKRSVSGLGAAALVVLSVTHAVAAGGLVIGAAGLVGALALACIDHRLSASGQRAGAAVNASPGPVPAAADART